MKQRHVATLAATTAALILSCGSGNPPPSEPPPPQPPDIASKMGEHFAAIVKVRGAVTRGELELAKKHAGEFTTHLRNADHPDGWQPHLQQVRKSLFGLAGTDNLEAAAASTARAGQACGACHAALGVEALGAGSEPPINRPTDLSEYMWLHLWASESMWNGLIGPSDAAWKEGASALGKAGLFPEGGDIELTDEMRALATELNVLGKEAVSAGDDERAAVYGKFLGACARCHQQLRDRAVD